MLTAVAKPDTAAVVAHRGARRVAAENTPEAFIAAAAQGAHGVELDVRRSGDGALIVYHDAAIPGVGAIVAHTAAELAELAPHVVDLRRALDACAGMWVNIEVKNSPADPDWDPDDAVAGAVCNLIDELGVAASIVVSSFNPATVVAVRKQAPEVATGWLVHDWKVRQATLTAAELGAWALHPNAGMLAGARAAEAVALGTQLGLEILVWTVNDPDEARRLSDAGVFAVFTDDPAAVAARLSAG